MIFLSQVHCDHVAGLPFFALIAFVLNPTLEQAERGFTSEFFIRCDGNQSAAARRVDDGCNKFARMLRTGESGERKLPSADTRARFIA